MCVDCDFNFPLQSQSEDTLGKPEMSSPPPWLREKVNFNFGSPTNSSEQTPSLSNLDHSQMVSPTSPSPEHPLSPLLKDIVGRLQEEQNPTRTSDETVPKEICSEHPLYHMELETEFPVNNASPKLKHVYHSRHSGVVSVKPANDRQTQGRTLTEAPSRGANSSSAESGEKNVLPVLNNDKDSLNRAQQSQQPIRLVHNQSHDPSEPVLHNKSHDSASPIRLVAAESQSEEAARSASPQSCDPATQIDQVISPGQELLKLADSFHEKFLVNEKDGLPRIQNNLFDTDSEEEGSSRPISNAFSAASTVSLNELLERELDEMETPNDEGFSLDALPIFEALSAKYEKHVAKLSSDMAANQDEGDENCQRDPACDWSASRLSKSSSQSESSVQSQRLVVSPGGESLVLNNGKVSNTSSPSMQRPNTLHLGQQDENSDSSSESDSDLPTPNDAQSLECTRLKNQIDSTNKAKCKIPSPKQSLATSPKHKFHNLSKSNTSLKGCMKENHPLKLYNVQSPPGSNEEILEKFKRQPPKTKPKPSIKNRFRRKSQGDGKETESKTKSPSETRPEVDGRECVEEEKQMMGNGEKSRRNNLVNTVGVQESTDSADPMTSSCSSGSPDSAMQQSFSSSSSSDNTLSDKPSCRDDGYLSNSTISMSSTDIPGDGHLGSLVQTLSAAAQGSQSRSKQPLFRRRSQPQSGTGLEPHSETEAEALTRRRSEPQYDNTNMNANPSDAGSQNKIGIVQIDSALWDVNVKAMQSLPVGLNLGVHGSRDSVASNVSQASIESNPIGRVRDIKAFFESKVDEKLRSKIQQAEKCQNAQMSESNLDAGKSCNLHARHPGICDKNNVGFSRSCSTEERRTCRPENFHDPQSHILQGARFSEMCHSDEVQRLLADCGGQYCLRRYPSDSYLVQAKYCQFYTTQEQDVSLSRDSPEKVQLPRLQHCWSDSRLNSCMADVHRKEARSLHTSLKQDWAKFCSRLSYQKRSLSAPASNCYHRKRSISPSAPRLLTRRSQKNQSCEMVRLSGEGAETKDSAQPQVRP